MISIAAALQNGILPSELHAMVERAAGSIAGQPPPRSPPLQPDWCPPGMTPALPNPLLQSSQPISHPLQGLVNAANSLGMASSAPTSQTPQQQPLLLPSGLPHMFPAASGTYDDTVPGLPQAEVLQAPDELGGSWSQPAADDAAAVGLRVRSQSSADRNGGNPVAFSISPMAPLHLTNGAALQAPGPAPPLGQGSQAAAETLEGGSADDGHLGTLERQSQPQQPAATAAEGDGVGIPPDAQPLRRKRTKRVKVEVPRDLVDDSASDGIPRARNENGHSYRNGSLKVSQWYTLGFVHPPMNGSLGCAGSASCLCCSSEIHEGSG